VINRFISNVKTQALGLTETKSLNPAQQIANIVREELSNALGAGLERKVNFAKKPPTVIMLAGLQGSGKTTFAAKLALHFLKQKNTPLLVAADLQRPNAVDQLKTLGARVGVDVFAPEPGVRSQTDADDHSESSLGRIFSRRQSPVNVAKQGVEHAKRKQYNIVIVDTAGRLGVDQEMMKEARAIENAINPNESLFVIDSMTGQDAANIGRAFADAVDVSGIVLTKLDSDARGGAALSVSEIIKKPILFASTGEHLDDLEVFHPERMASRILELGDVESLIERAEISMDKDKLQGFSQKIAEGEKFNFNDYVEQLDELQKMGNLKSVIGMIPGMAKYKQAIEQFDERDLQRNRSIILSMTPAERENPDLLDGSRKKRLALGSGTRISDVNTLLDQFKQMNMMTQAMRSKGKKKLPKGMPPELANSAFSGANRSNGSKTAKSKRKKFGNPAKQAAWSASQSR
jgi:signal recognition particle subunit SRP54